MLHNANVFLSLSLAVFLKTKLKQKRNEILLHLSESKYITGQTKRKEKGDIRYITNQRNKQIFFFTK